MSLVAHSDLMDRIYRRQRHVYDLTRKFYLLGRDRLIDELHPAAGDNVLEIGCGTARNLIRAAGRYPQARFYGIDISHEMLATAFDEVGRARLARADAARFDPKALFGVGSFQRIFISYTLSMIPAWDEVLVDALAHLAPDGELHVVDFGGQEGLPAWFRQALRAWLSLFHVEPRDDLAAAFSLLALRTGARVHIERPYRGYAQLAVARSP
jgi:S-adenosylmethionine-diacylgycerolhomoserine-N-methlytransferase